jgi:hypothetical protein
VHISAKKKNYFEMIRWKAKSKATNTKNPGEAIGISIASAWIHEHWIDLLNPKTLVIEAL